MPQGNGTGPTGQRPHDGRGQGQGYGGGGQSGPDGECVCPACGATAPHQRGVPCSNQTCPNCGARMTRK